MNKKIVLCLVVTMSFCLVLGYLVRFYPQQQMPVGEPINIKTPEPEKYHNDCLHPCIRRLNDSAFVLVQSPYYGWNNKVENPMVFYSNNLHDWGIGCLLDDTPSTGFNSDPNVFVEDSILYFFWRVCGTPLCKDKGMCELVIGGRIDSLLNSNYDIYIQNSWEQGDITQCPILIKHNEEYLFYATWYQYSPQRKNKGIAIWKGTSLEDPDFVLTDTLMFDNPLVCDKWVQKKIFHHIWYIPIPKRYDLWHYDLFEYEDNLFMVSCAEKDDNIMLSVSKDWKHFKTIKTPLVNNHYSENYTGYRQYFYKPTAIVENDTLFLFYTSNSKEDSNRNQLFLSVKAMKDLYY